jgi:hypothetical protein
VLCALCRHALDTTRTHKKSAQQAPLLLLPQDVLIVLVDVGPQMEQHLPHLRRALFLLAESKVRVVLVTVGVCARRAACTGSRFATHTQRRKCSASTCACGHTHEAGGPLPRPEH